MCVRLEWRKRPLKYTVSSTLHFFFFLILLNTHRSHRVIHVTMLSYHASHFSCTLHLLEWLKWKLMEGKWEKFEPGTTWNWHLWVAYFYEKAGYVTYFRTNYVFQQQSWPKWQGIWNLLHYQLFNTKKSQKFCKSFQRADVAVVAYQLPALSISMFFTFNDHSMKKPYRSSRLITSPSKPMWYDSLPLTPAEHWFRILPPPPPPPPPQWIYLVEI